MEIKREGGTEMDTAMIVELISSLGFPIVTCAALAFFVFKLWEQSADRENKLFTELSESRTINAKFAEIIAGYEIKLDEIKADVKDIRDILQASEE